MKVYIYIVPEQQRSKYHFYLSQEGGHYNTPGSSHEPPC